MNTSIWGWNAFFEEQYAPFRDFGLLPARIIRDFGRSFMAGMPEGTIEAKVSGHFHYTAQSRADYPAVGDWVLLRKEDGAAVIEKVLERRSRFSRGASGNDSEEQVIAANIDLMFVVAALDGGRNFNIRGIERYLVMVRTGGAEPVLVLNKSDLCAERDDFLTQAMAVAAGAPVLTASAVTGEGLEEMENFLEQGITAALTGPSGVGKSALVNALSERRLCATGEVRDDDRRGRHTTTGGGLFALPSGALIIDTPGLRELSPLGDTDSLDPVFPEIAAAAERCRFRDCTHTSEPGCAVLALLSEGAIELSRYQNFITIRSEMEFRNSMNSSKGRMERKARDKALSKMVRNYLKNSQD
jgi:ribosome biogenesis GTPase